MSDSYRQTTFGGVQELVLSNDTASELEAAATTLGCTVDDILTALVDDFVEGKIELFVDPSDNSLTTDPS